MRRLAVFVCLLSGPACSQSKYAPVDSGFSDTADMDGDSADTGGGEWDYVDPAWWSLGAAVTILGGEADASATHLALTLTAEDGAELCEDTLSVNEITDTGELPDASIFIWWEIQASGPEAGCTAWDSPLPRKLYLGVGAMHPDIEANLDPAGLRGLETNLNASYASIDGGDTVYVYGVAGSEEAWLGVDPALTEGPLPDGTWIIKPIYPFPF